MTVRSRSVEPLPRFPYSERPGCVCPDPCATIQILMNQMLEAYSRLRESFWLACLSNPKEPYPIAGRATADQIHELCIAVLDAVLLLGCCFQSTSGSATTELGEIIGAARVLRLEHESDVPMEPPC